MSNNNNNGIGFFGLLTLLFIGLKLGGVLNWSWWLVLIIPVTGICLAIFALILGLVVVFLKRKG